MMGTEEKLSTISVEDITEYKKLVLQILIDFSNFLNENNIKFSLSGGTLLGAIRHKGFIPWDDDIDINIYKDEYKKLIIIVKNFEDQRYQVVLPDDDINIGYPRAIKIYYRDACIKEIGNNYFTGPFIDVFTTLDFDPKKNVKRYFGLYRALTTILNIKNNRINFNTNKTRCAKLMKILAKFIPLRLLHKEIKKYFDFENKENELCVISYGVPQLCKKSFFSETVNGRFEGTVFPIPKEYKEYLTLAYGNYLELPPENKRTLKHLLYLNFNERYNDKN